MRPFAWLTFLTGIVLSGIAGYYSVVGLATIFTGAYWSVVVLAGILEIAKIVAVTWLYRYRHLAGWMLRGYFYAAVLILMMITSMGIFGHLSRAHAETEGSLTATTLTLSEIAQRESAIQSHRDNLTTELSSLNTQANQLVTQLSTAERLTGSSGAVSVQRQLSARRQAILTELKETTAELSAIQQERIAISTETSKVTAEIGPLRYIAKAVYGTEDADTIRKSVMFLTVAMMVVFDPLALMLLIAANVLFLRLQTAPDGPRATISPKPPHHPELPPAAPTEAPETHATDIPVPLNPPSRA